MRMFIPLILAALALPVFAAPPGEVTDDDLILSALQEAVFLEGNEVDTGRQFLKQAAGLSDETSYALLKRAKQIVREVENDVPRARAARASAVR